MKHSATTLLIVATTLSACSGGGSSNDAPQRQSFTELFDLFLEIESNYEYANVDDITDPATLPPDGISTYRGVLGAEIPDGAGDELTVVGQMTMRANFTEVGITGTVQNFVDENEATYIGQLEISNGFIDREAEVEDQFTFAAALDGDISNSTEGPVNFDMLMRGDFYGDNHQFVAGDMVGDVTTNNGNFELDGADTFFSGER